jgi:hypothetical protein
MHKLICLVLKVVKSVELLREKKTQGRKLRKTVRAVLAQKKVKLSL